MHVRLVWGTSAVEDDSFVLHATGEPSWKFLLCSHPCRRKFRMRHVTFETVRQPRIREESQSSLTRRVTQEIIQYQRGRLMIISGINISVQAGMDVVLFDVVAKDTVVTLIPTRCSEGRNGLHHITQGTKALLCSRSRRTFPFLPSEGTRRLETST